MSVMRVVIMTHAAGSPQHGPNLRWYYLGRRLKELGCDVTIVGSSFFHKYIEQPKVSGAFTEEHIDGIDYVFVRNVRYRRFLGRLLNQFIYPIMSFFWARKEMNKRRVDLVLASSPPPFCIYAAEYLAKKTGASLIFEVRDLWPMVVQELSSATSSHPYIKMLKKTEAYAVNNSDMVVSVKPGDFDYFKREYGLSESKFSFLPNGFLPSESLSSASSVEESLQKEKLVVGYVGAMSAYYGLNELLEAADKLKANIDIKFVLVGGGDDYESLHSLAEKKKIYNVEFVGKVPKSQVSKYLTSFDICYVGLKDVKANQHGISCNKIFEYMHAGKPIIASYNTKFDPVQDGDCGITVSPGSPEAVVEAILELKGSPEKRKALGENGRAYFDANHDFRVIGEKYFHIMKELRSNG